MSEAIIFTLEKNGRTVFRLIGKSDSVVEQIIGEGKPTVTNIYDRAAMVAMAKAILAWDEVTPQ